MDLTGPVSVARQLGDLTAVAILLAICTAVGLEVLAQLRVRYDAALESLLFGLGLGSGVVAIVLLCLGLAGGLGGPGPELAVLACAGLAARQWKRFPALLGGACRTLIGDGGRARAAVLTVAGFATLFVLLLALAPPVAWDSLMYHLRVPAEYLDRGRIYLPEDNLHAALVGLPHMLYLPLLRVGSASAPAVWSAAMTVVLALTMFSLASRFWGDAAGLASLLFLWTNPVVLLVGGSARIDVTLAGLLLLAHYALLLALVGEGGRANVYVAALLAGFAVATKLHALVYDAALVPLALVVLRGETTTLRQAAARLALCAIVAGAAAAPYLVKNEVLLGAPLYPFLAKPALEPWLVPAFHRATVPAGAAAGAFQAMAQVRRPFNVVDAFLHPDRLTVEREGAFYFASPALVLLVLWPVLWRDRRLAWLGLPAVAYLAMLLGAFPRTNLRYLMPATGPLSVVAAVIAVRVGGRTVARRAQPLIGSLAAALALGPSLATASVWLSRTEVLSYAVGRTSAGEFLATHRASAISPYWQVVRFANDSLPADSRVLELFEGRAYYFRRRVLADPRLTNWPLLGGTSAPDNCLRSLGVTHVLMGEGAIGYYLGRGLQPGAVRLDALERFKARCLRPVYAAPGLTLYRVSPPSP